MNECLTTPQHVKQICYWVSKKGKCMNQNVQVKQWKNMYSMWNVKIFSDTLNTFYLRLYGIGHMVNDHSDSKRENLLLPLHGLLFLISSKGYFICTIPQTGKHMPRPLIHQSWSTGWNESSSIDIAYMHVSKILRSENPVQTYFFGRASEHFKKACLPNNDFLSQ